jgi:hypothetical protein
VARGRFLCPLPLFCTLDGLPPKNGLLTKNQKIIKFPTKPLDKKSVSL